MLEVKFYEKGKIDDSSLKFAVIVSRYNGKWIYCKHKERETWEIPGGHREEGETIYDTAKRELFEETGATLFELSSICIYSVKREKEESYGMLMFAEIKELGLLPETEIERIAFFEAVPEELTYPLIQPHLLKKAVEFIK